MSLTAHGLAGGVLSEVIGVAAVRGSAIAAAVALVGGGGGHMAGLLRLVMVGSSGDGESTGGEESNTSDDVGELHFDWVDGIKLRKEDEFDSCLGWK